MRSKAQMNVTRVLTDTPLAKVHEKNVAMRRGGEARPIEWSAFEPSKYSTPALALGASTARSLATGELGAVALFGNLASALALNGAPFDLVSEAARIPADEIRHAELALTMAARCASSEPAEQVLSLDRDVLERRCAPLHTMEELDAMMIELPAISETLAAALLQACRDVASDPVARAFYANVVRDEVHHARFGWYYLAWRAPQWTEPERQRIADRVGVIVQQMEKRFWVGRDAPVEYACDARALGVLDSVAQRAALHDVVENEILPGLDAFGLGASRAWKARAPVEASADLRR